MLRVGDAVPHTARVDQHAFFGWLLDCPCPTAIKAAAEDMVFRFFAIDVVSRTEIFVVTNAESNEQFIAPMPHAVIGMKHAVTGEGYAGAIKSLTLAIENDPKNSISLMVTVIMFSPDFFWFSTATTSSGLIVAMPFSPSD